MKQGLIRILCCSLILASVHGCHNNDTVVVLAGDGSALRIFSFSSATLGILTSSAVFSEGPSSSLGGNGLLTLSPSGSIRVSIPPEFRNVGCVLEIQFNYLDGGEAHFLIEDDTSATIAEGDVDNDEDDGHQTFTLLVDLTPFIGTSYITLTNTSSTYDLLFNPYLQLFKVEALNPNGVFLADLRAASSRVNGTNTDASGVEWLDCVYSPDDFWSGGDVEFNIADIIASMTQPVIEFNFGRERDDDCDLYLYDSTGTEIAYWFADYDSDEAMGQTLIVDLTMYKASPFFVTNQDSDTYVSPFVKIYDAAVQSAAGLVLDVAPGGRNFVSAAGKFTFYAAADDYPDGGMYDDNVGCEAPHWLADPTRLATIGQEGTLTFMVPAVVSTWSHPVLEICHWAPDSESFFEEPVMVQGGPTNPDYYPIEFYLETTTGTEIAHIYFDEWEDDQGGVLKNQIPLGSFKSFTTLRIRVPATSNEWSQAAFAPFIKIFNAVE